MIPLNTPESSPSGKERPNKIQINEDKNEIVEFEKDECTLQVRKKKKDLDAFGYSKKYDARLFYNLRQAQKGRKVNEKQVIQEAGENIVSDVIHGQNTELDNTQSALNKNLEKKVDQASKNVEINQRVTVKRSAESPLHSPPSKKGRKNKVQITRVSPVKTRSKTRPKVIDLPATNTRSKKRIKK
ncbi:unnamed protein product [Brugia timori]|uniref:Uncharacterized protein n=1 Tax=Brugia timori TaxID=42155 RepID=A0A0R3Q5B3_9BILA|nr:unnamed protein product [Brugia timori]